MVDARVYETKTNKQNIAHHADRRTFLVFLLSDSERANEVKRKYLSWYRVVFPRSGSERKKKRKSANRRIVNPRFPPHHWLWKIIVKYACHL
jgi:hypothetical protein